MLIRASFVCSFTNVVTNIFDGNFVNNQSPVIVREINSIDIATDFLVIDKPFDDWWWMRFDVTE